jgi:hypothetical protein
VHKLIAKVAVQDTLLLARSHFSAFALYCYSTLLSFFLVQDSDFPPPPPSPPPPPWFCQHPFNMAVRCLPSKAIPKHKPATPCQQVSCFVLSVSALYSP